MAGIMNLDQMSYEERLLIGLEALLRRAALVNGPFALKGSLLTRQYLADRSVRDADDIDFCAWRRFGTRTRPDVCSRIG